MKKTVFLFIASLLMISMAWATTYAENFDTVGNWGGGTAGSYNAKTYTNASDPSNDVFSSNNAVREDADTYSGAYAWRVGTGAYYFRYECEETVSGFSVYLARWDNNPVPSITIRYSTNSGSSYTDIETITGAWFTGDKAYKEYTHSFSTPISPTSGNKIYIELNKTTGERLLVDDFELEYGSGSPTPTITVAPSALSGFGYAVDYGPSAYKTFSVSGSNLKDNIGLTAPTNYEISQSSGSGYTGSISLTQSGGSVAETTIYVRLKSGLSAGDYNGENITAASTDATSKTVTCSGSVTAPILAAWEFNGVTTALTTYDATTQDSNISTSTISRGAGLVAASLNNAFSSNNYSGSTKANAITNNHYQQVVISPVSGKKVSLSTINANFRRSSTGPNTFIWQYSLDGFTTSGVDIGSEISFTDEATNGIAQATIDLSGISALQNVNYNGSVTLRLYGWGTTNTEGTFAIGRLEGNDLVIGGSSADADQPVSTITTGAVSTPPFYVDSATSASGTVAYTSTGAFSGATFTAYLSDASGSFASSTSIGTASITGTNPSGNISISIPAGTTEGSGYKIRIDCASPAITGSTGSAFTIQNGAKNVTGASVSAGNGSLTVSWTNPTTIYDEVMIVAKASASISSTPSGDGSSYTADLAYGSGTAFDSGYVVYKGAISPQTITNLTNQTTYYVKVFTRKNSNWSSGVEINNTPMAMPAIVDIIVPQFMQGLNGTNNQRIPTAFRFRLDNLTPSATYRYAGQMVLASSGETDTGGGNPWYANSDNSFTRTTSPGLSTSGAYGEFTTDTNGSYTGWFMIEPTANNNFTPGNEVFWRVRLNDGAGGTSVARRLTSASAIKVINFGTQENVNQGTFLRGVSQSPAKNFIFVYDNEAGTGRPISGTVVESDGLDLSAVAAILPLYKNHVDGIAGAWGLIIPNSVGSKGFTGIKRIESRNLSDANIYGEATDSDGVWTSGTDTTNPTGGDTGSHLVMGEGDATLPVELSSFTVTMNAYNAAVLTWVTQTETGVNGFYIYRGTTDILSEAVMVSSLIPATNTSQTQVYRYSDSELYGPGTYYYWLNASDMDGTESFHGPITLVYETGENPTPTIPKLTELKSIYPNPFNPSANISFGLAKSSDVEFKIYNSRGQMVRNMALGVKDAGTWNLVWNGTDNNGRAVPTGIYYIQMQAGKDSFIRKAVMMK